MSWRTPQWDDDWSIIKIVSPGRPKEEQKLVWWVAVARKLGFKV